MTELLAGCRRFRANGWLARAGAENARGGVLPNVGCHERKRYGVLAENVRRARREVVSGIRIGENEARDGCVSL
jgi:hypothetical protein